MSLKKETSVSITVDHEELDYEEDVDNAVKNCPVALEKQDDVEEGEILDVDSEDYPNKKICEFFKLGRCQLGDHCRYLHVTDKGLYRMLEVPSPTSSFALPPQLPLSLFQLQLNNVQPVVNTSKLDNCEQRETSPTAWDRALKEAKKLVKKWDTKVKETSNPTVITIDSDDEPPSNKSPKKPRCYKSPEPKVISGKPSLFGNFGVSPARNIVDNKNEKHREAKWHDPWRRSPVCRTKPPLRSSKIRRKKSSASSSSSECSSRWFRRRKQNCLSISERRRRENVEKRHKKTSRRYSSSSFSPESVYRPINDERETKLQSTQEEKKESPTVANRQGRNLKSNDPIKKDLPSITPIHEENRHKAVPRRSTSRSPGPTSRRTSAKEEKKISPIVENKLDRNFKNDPIKRDLSLFTPALAENWHKAGTRRSSSRSPGPTSRRTSAKEEKKISPIVENKLDRNFKNDPIKRDLSLFTPALAENWHKAGTRRSSSRSPGPASLYQSRRTSAKERSVSAKEDRKKSPTVENKFDRNLKNDTIKRDLPPAHAENWHNSIARRSSPRSPGPSSMYQSRRASAKERRMSATEDRKKSPTVENKFDRDFKNNPIKKNLPSFTPAHAENWHKAILRVSSSRSPGRTSMYQSRRTSAKERSMSAKEDRKKSPTFENKFDRNFKNDPVTKHLPSFTPTHAENWYKAISRRCSRSPSPASMYQSRRTSSKEEKKNSPIVENKFDRDFKPNEAIKRLHSPASAYAENRHKSISRESSSRSPGSVYRSRSDKSKIPTKSQSVLQEKNKIPYVVSRNLKLKEPVKKDLPFFIQACAENRHKAIPCTRSNSCSPASAYRSRNEKSKSGTKLQSTKQEKSIENKADKNLKGKGIEKELPPFSFTSALQSSDVRKWTPRKMRPLSPPVDSCSDMSISPLSDHYLSDLFDPDKKANKLGGTRQREMNRPRTFLPWKRHSAEVYGPICPQASQLAAQSISPAPKCVTENKAVDLSKPRKVKKRNTCALEADLLKFQHRHRIVVPQPISEKNDIQREADTKSNKTSKINISQTQIMIEAKKNETSKEAPLVQRKQISKKEMLLKQLDEINAAIEKRKQMSGFQRQ